MAKTKKITSEQLARIIQKGFENTASKQDLHIVDKKIDALHEEMNLRFDGVDRRLDSVESEVKDIKTILGPLVRTLASMEFDIRELQARVNKLEKKISLK